MASLSLKNLNKKYENGFEAVKSLNLDIQDKEFVVLVGPSGCGKSTTLRMVAGLESVTGGEIIIQDRVVNDIEPKDRDLAMVFQNYALYPHMSVYDNMAFALKLRKTPKKEIRERVESAAGILEISDLLDRKPKQLSGGQRQRVALGRAIVRDPKVFLMDEPLSNLDAKLRVQMRSEIIKLHKKLDTTFIYVTHDQTEAMTMGDRIVVMNGGEVQQVATPRDIYDKPANVFVAKFIGSPQMNFIRCRASQNVDRLETDFGEGWIEVGKGAQAALKAAGYGGKHVMVGVRPEHIRLSNSLDKSSIKAKVEVTEHLGSETYLYSRGDAGNIVLRVSPSERVEVGQEIKIALEESKIHIFDEETEKRIY